MGYVLSFMVGMVIAGIIFGGERAKLENKIYRLQKENRKLENSVGEVYGGE